MWKSWCAWLQAYREVVSGAYSLRYAGDEHVTAEFAFISASILDSNKSFERIDIKDI